MPGPNQVVEGLFMDEEEEEDATKIRKREFCPSSTSSSSALHNYRFKKAVLVGKRGGSSTPVPSWRVVSSRSPSISLRMAATTTEPPRRSTSAQIMQPVSARKLAATLWELNDVPVAAPRRRRVVESSVHWSFSPRLSDPSHSPLSERSERSGTRAHSQHQSSSACRRRNSNAIDVGIIDSVSNASFMEQTETKSRHQSQNHGGYMNNLKDVSNTLTTSKELLKIISRMWGQQDNRSTTTKSLITALHTELERARLQINQMVKEQRTDQNSISYLVNRFSEEKAAWKNKQKQKIRAAIESIKEELEVERKLRRRMERLNKKLGNELTDQNSSINHGSPGFSSSEEEGEVEDLVIEDDDSANTNKYCVKLNSLRRSTSLVSQSGGRLCEFEKKAHRRSCGDDLQRYKTVKGLRDQILCGSNSRRSSSSSRR